MVSPPTLTRTAAPNALRPERKTPSETIWGDTVSLVNKQLEQAREHLSETGLPSGDTEAVAFATALQRETLTQAEKSGEAENWPLSTATAERLALVVLEMPLAARAINTLSKPSLSNPVYHGAVSQTCQFNHSLGEAFAYMHPSLLPNFADTLHRTGSKILAPHNQPIPPKSELHDITAGIKREVGVRRALLATAPEDWEIRQGTVQEDQEGIDLVIQHDGKRLDVDVKSQNSFHNLVLKMVQEKQITLAEAEHAVNNNYIYRPGYSNQGNGTCIFNADGLGGKREGFEYSNPEGITDFIQERLKDTPTTLQKLGRTAIIT